ncbi:Predicted acyltransferase, LPLAT superfamily [Roseomonas rosea]|uniref:Predicted acyltransferase, LPLAT superfamily n=1 Tax=Muricoccus roseus TaxID=198092 RepID=A0A1M6NQD5_9PROT|nr:LolA-related protein [Roseomonas rosea]SHJ97933.1 Predicted acyltransferase, LPLAT superfamily [Roseomonas rosea]
MSWLQQRERGGAALRLMGWIARVAGWRLSYALLFPVTAYFLLTAPARQKEAVRRFQRRALGRETGWRDLWRPYFAFAATMLDRVYLLRGQTTGFRITVSGLEALDAKIAEGQGCVLLGAHLGSFTAMRALADGCAGRRCPVEVMAFMYEANAQLANKLFSALSQEKAQLVVPLGRPDSMLRAKECLERGGLVGILADRRPAVGEDRVVPLPFLGASAPFPAGPHILAAVLKAPVMLAFGIWKGPRRYEILFEPFADRVVLNRASREEDLRAVAARYAVRLEVVARAHPENWFNFYDFWEEMAEPAAAAAPARGPSVARRAALGLPLLALPRLARAQAQPETGGLEAVMAALSAVRRTEAVFEESKSIAGLADTLSSSGTLRWEAPSTLEKRVVYPFAEQVTVSGARLVYERAGRERQEVNLDQAPEVRALVEAIRSTLAGDLAVLREHYEVGFSGSLQDWTLRLSPLSMRVRAVVQRVEVQGAAGRITRFETVGNESSVMRISYRS